VQPNVIKKSWTTSNISSSVKKVHARSEETPAFQSRDLIREYFLKTRVPDILKPVQGRRHSANYTTSAMTSDMNFAYKHPLVAAEELKRSGGESMADDLERKLCNVADNSSIIVPKTISHSRKTSRSGRAHLIGNVTPSIAKTWEQLSNAIDSSFDNPTHEEEDKQSYVLFVRKPFNFHQSDEKFDVKKIQHDDCEQFFDSIDNEIQFADEYEDESTEGGEMMADELDSLEMRCNDIILWSIES
jgi:hypothetical protein